MSRIGKIPVKLPSGVKVNITADAINVEGPKGKLSQSYLPGVVSFEVKKDEVVVSRPDDEKQSRAYHGLYRSLLQNMVVGVSTGFTKSLVVTGVGYRAEVQGNIMVMNLGFSQEIYVGIPEGLKVTVDDKTNIITITGADKQAVGEFAADVRKLRKPEPYKGKGVAYQGEHIRRKVGKSGVK
jgi:large subunit ribosomal protein L6